MTSPNRWTTRLVKPLGHSTKLLLPVAVVLAIVVAAAAIKGWPILPFLQTAGPRHDPDDWCTGHGVPESLCTLCHPELKDKLLMCVEHGLPEALCTLCHPELAERFVMCREHNLPESYCTVCNPPEPTAGEKPDWCAEHGVPESLCTLCNKDLAVALCTEHRVPESLCTVCNPALAEQIPTCPAHGLPSAFCPVCKASSVASFSPGGESTDSAPTLLLPKGSKSVSLCRLDLPMVRLASAQTGRDAGIEVVQAQTRTLQQTIACNGRAIYDQNHYAQVRPRTEGIVQEVRVEAGAKVRRGDVLAVINSVPLGQAKAAYLTAAASLDLAGKNFERLQKLAENQVLPGKSLLEGENRRDETRIQENEMRQQLVSLGLSPSEIERLTQTREVDSLLSITAPLDGVVVRRHAVQGEAVQATDELFAVADLTTLWIHLDLDENDLRWVREGQAVTFAVESLSEMIFPGRVTWIDPEVDPQTRTIQVRAEVENTRGQLRAGMYGVGVIRIDAPAEALVVPQTAVQRYERAPVVFVRKADDLFEPRRVTLGRKEGPFQEIAAGIQPDELIVTTGSFLLKTELMKGSIGAGCCGD